MHITNLYYVGESGVLKSVLGDTHQMVGDISNLIKEDMYSDNDISGIENISPLFYDFLYKNEIDSILIVRIGMELKTYGYLVCAEPHIKRIWQEDECGIMYFIAKCLASGIHYENEKIL